MAIIRAEAGAAPRGWRRRIETEGQIVDVVWALRAAHEAGMLWAAQEAQRRGDTELGARILARADTFGAAFRVALRQRSERAYRPPDRLAIVPRSEAG